MDIGERIKVLRKDILKLTQIDFGKKIKLKPTAIGQMESGHRTVTDRSIFLICNVFNINEEWLRNGNGDIFLTSGNTNQNLLIKDRLKKLRTNLNLSQDEFGEKLNLTRSSISNYEKGTRNISFRVIADICREFNVNENWLLNGIGNMFIEKSTNLLDELADKYKLDEIDKKIIDTYLNSSQIERTILKSFCIKVATLINENLS